MIKCRAGEGVCPDTMISGGGGLQDVTGVTGSVVNGLRCIEYTRPLNTGTLRCINIPKHKSFT